MNSQATILGVFNATVLGRCRIIRPEKNTFAVSVQKILSHSKQGFLVISVFPFGKVPTIFALFRRESQGVCAYFSVETPVPRLGIARTVKISTQFRDIWDTCSFRSKHTGRFKAWYAWWIRFHHERRRCDAMNRVGEGEDPGAQVRYQASYLYFDRKTTL